MAESVATPYLPPFLEPGPERLLTRHSIPARVPYHRETRKLHGTVPGQIFSHEDRVDGFLSGEAGRDEPRQDRAVICRRTKLCGVAPTLRQILRGRPTPVAESVQHLLQFVLSRQGVMAV